ncbi:MAG TPA: SH3 domain-containing protein [bacterium]
MIQKTARLPALLLTALLAFGLTTVGSAQAATTLCVKSQKANLRSGPGTNFRVTWEVHRYMPLVKVGQNGEWIKVRDVDGDLHWVSQSVVTADESCVTTKVNKATIRKAPNAKAPQWFQVERYTSFKRTGNDKKDWVKLEHEGKVMWASTTVVWPG